MKTAIISFCLIWAIYANPITFDIVLGPHDLVINSTESLSLSQSSENDTSEVKSSEESVSDQSSESSSSESFESSDNTSEESESDSVESNEQTEFLVETRDDSMGSEENVRKSWVRVFATVARDMSTEDNSTEVTAPPDLQNNMTDKKQPAHASTVKTLKHGSKKTKMALVQKSTVNSDSSSESAESNESTVLTTALTADSSQSVSSESNETSSASDSASDSAQSSESAEDSNASDSKELNQIRDCVNGTLSCESEEEFFQEIGDDAQYSVDNLLVPDEDDRELSLRR